MRKNEGVYELYPFVVGRPFNPDNEEEVASVARAQAEFHKVAGDYCSPSS